MISAAVLAPQTLGIGWLLYAPLVVWAVLRSPWVELFADRRRQHLLFGTVFALFMLWLVRRDFDTGVSYHFIGMTAVTLLLDWPLAMVGGLAAQLGLVLLGRQDMAAVGINGLLLIVLPVLVTEGCAALVERAQPRNPFVYIFCSGFFAAALSALLCLLAALGLLWFDGRFAMPEWLEDFVGYLWLIIFPRRLSTAWSLAPWWCFARSGWRHSIARATSRRRGRTTIRGVDPDQIRRGRAGSFFAKFPGAKVMSVYEWARQELRRSQDAAQEIGFDPGLTLRAMLSAVVQQSKGVRSLKTWPTSCNTLQRISTTSRNMPLCGLSGAAAGLRRTVRPLHPG